MGLGVTGVPEEVVDEDVQPLSHFRTSEAGIGRLLVGIFHQLTRNYSFRVTKVYESWYSVQPRLPIGRIGRAESGGDTGELIK